MTARDDRFYPRLFSVAALGLLGWVLFRIFKPFLGPVVWSILLAFLLQPLVERLKRRLGRRAGLAPGLLTAGAALCVALPAVALGVEFSNQISQLLVRVSGDARLHQIEQPSDFFRLAPAAAALAWVHSHFPVTAAELERRTVEIVRRGLELLAERSGLLVLGAIGMVLNLVLTLFLLFFFLRDGAATIVRLDRAVPLPEERKRGLANQLASLTRAVVLGTLVTAVVQGALVGIAFGVVGFPSPVVFGALAAALSLLPVGGTAIVWIPGAVVLAAQGRWPWAVGLAFYCGVIVSLVTNNVLKPRHRATPRSGRCRCSSASLEDSRRSA